MSRDSHEPRLQVVRDGDVTVVRFTSATSLNEYTSDRVGQELSSLTLDRADQVVTLDLNNIEYLTSTILGHLVSLNKRLRTGGGRLSVKNAKPAIVEVFRVTQLDQVLDIQ